MEKRVLLAIFLSFLVLFVYQSLFVQPPPERVSEPAAAVTAEDTAPIVPRVTEPTARVEPVTDSILKAEGEAAAPEVLVGDTEARDILVETELVQAVFSTRGARLTSWRLNTYLDAAGEPLELVPQGLDDAVSRPFSLAVEDEALTERLREVFFKPSAEVLYLVDEPASLTFEYRDSTGLHARKVFRFDPVTEPFVVRFTADVTTGEGSIQVAIDMGPGVGSGLQASQSRIGYRQPPQGIFFQAEDVSRLDASDIEEQPFYSGSFGFVGVDDHYFISAALPDATPVQVQYQPLSIGQGESARTLMAYTLLLPAVPEDVRFFFGPKDFDVLGDVDHEFVRAVHFGVFSWLVVPLHRSLKWVYGYVGNYGWAIVILTIMINAAMFPLRHKSVVSMRKMQELQPEMKAIQDRYKGLKATDPAKQKMNQEVMNLYRERGVNPAGGCLPMLLTMPVLFAFYSLLSVAIEIRGAPFVLWIRDLSQYDPMYVTPLLMGATMVAQQRMTPSTADPTQQKVMMFMPIVFTFMFLWAPSGLVLYWFVSNLWGVGQQIITNRIIGPPRVHNVRPPAERQVKKPAERKGGKVRT